jgi:hypothetical protein
MIGLDFALPAPEEFRPQVDQLLALTPDEEQRVRSQAQARQDSAAQTAQALQQARQDKYRAAYLQWYRWTTTHQPPPRTYTAEQLLAWFHQEAKQQLGRPFVVDEANRQILHLLCLYFAQDTRFETDYGYALHKGLLLRGGVGVGKTTLLKIFDTNPRQPYRITCCQAFEQLVTASSGGGVEALAPFTKLLPLPRGQANRYHQHTHAGLALDDIGIEEWQLKHYGNPLNVVEHVLTARYNAQLPYWTTHGTTNLRFDDDYDLAGNLILGLGSRYGSRCRSRMREMFNLLDFPLEAPDRRG